MPYIYSLAGKVYFEDYTIMRGLAMDFPGDTRVYNIADQYLFGPSLLICPVTQYQQRQRAVYLPGRESWYDLYSGKFNAAGQTLTAEAPYARMPVFVRAGSILPVGPEIEYTGQEPDAPIDIYVYTGADGSFGLYEDEGTNYNYEKGQCSLIPFNWSDASRELTIGARKGQFEGMTAKRTFRIILVTGRKPVPFLSADAGYKEIHYEGNEMSLRF
ncbi:MAG: DUF5110 domain-containing protein [Mangrovibacterium sp.]